MDKLITCVNNFSTCTNEDQGSIGIVLALLSIVISLLAITFAFIIFFVDKRCPHIWHKWRFREKKYHESLEGEGYTVYFLEGKKRADSGNGNEKVNFKSYFKEPKLEEPTFFKVTNASININPQDEVQCKGRLNYIRNGQEKSAKIEGIGQYIRKSQDNFDGSVTIFCNLTEENTDANPYKWKTTFFLERNAKNDKWEGFWMRSDERYQHHFRFGKAELRCVEDISE